MKCQICGDEHKVSKCPALYNPLKDGFYAETGHTHTSNDESQKTDLRIGGRWVVPNYPNQQNERRSVLLQHASGGGWRCVSVGCRL